MAVPDIPPGFDFTDPDLYTSRVPTEELAELRRTSPVWWNAQRHGSAGFDDDGFWVVSRHADITDISKHSEVYSSYENTALIRHQEGIPREQIDMQRVILLNMDPPEHTKVRAIVSRGFTPKAINAMQDSLRERAERIVATALREGTGDFVADVACELPLQAIADLIGVPQEDRKKIFQWSNQMIGSDDPEFADAGMIASMEILAYAMQMADDRRVNPRDDIVTKLVNAEIDGEQLSADQFGYFVLMLSVAGNETTRNAITHGMLAFFNNPGPVGSSSRRSGRRRQPTRSSAGAPRSRCSSAPRWPTPGSAASRSRRATGSACSTGRPTSTKPSLTTPSGSTSPAAPTPTWAWAALARTTAWVPTSPRWRSG